jgi:fumarate hydratase class II
VNEHRIERDTMGEVRVPASALYGAQTARAVANFPISGERLSPRVIRALGLIKAAAAEVNAQAGLLDGDRAPAIAQAAREVAAGLHDGEFPVDVFQTGSGTSSNMNANEVVANRANELLGQPRGSVHVHPNDHVNLGQSSNDVFPSAVQIALLGAIDERLLPEMRHLAAALHDFGDRHWDVVRTGRTHLMDAMPIRVGQQFRGYGWQVGDSHRRVQQAAEGLGELPLGGTAVGTGVNGRDGFGEAVCAVLRRERGLDVRETGHHLHAQSGLDAVAQASASMRTFATALYKIANDLRWMASSAYGELLLPALQPGSSIMPAKVNPVVCEAVLMVCAQVFGNDAVVAFGNSQGQWELNTMMPVVGRNAIASAELLASACAVLREKALAGAAVTPAAAARVDRNPILATALNVAVGYETAARIAKAAAAAGRTVREVAAEMTSLSSAELDRLLDPAALCGRWGERRGPD